MKLGFIGAGNMAKAMIGGILKNNILVLVLISKKLSHNKRFNPIKKYLI